MAAAQSAGLHWAVRASLDEAGLLTTVVTRTGPGGTVTFRVPDPAPRGGQLVSMWIDRNPGTPGIPAFLLLHTTPDVVRASAVLASGGRRSVQAVTGDRGLPDPLRGRAAPERRSAGWCGDPQQAPGRAAHRTVAPAGWPGRVR